MFYLITKNKYSKIKVILLLIIIFSIGGILIAQKYLSYVKIKQSIREIKLFIVHPTSKQLKQTTVLTPKDEFLISFKYYHIDNNDKLKIILTKNNTVNNEILYDGPVEVGENNLCCFSAPSLTGSYLLTFIVGEQKINVPLIVEETPISYDWYRLSPQIFIPYPRWQLLDSDLINRFIKDIYSSFSTKLSAGFNVLLIVQDENNARVMISQRILTNYKTIPFGNIVQDILQQENKALVKAGIIDDFTILEQRYGNKEIYLKVRNINQGISYIIFNKTYETNNLLNQKVLINVALICPEKLESFYQPIADYIFNNIKLETPN